MDSRVRLVAVCGGRTLAADVVGPIACRLRKDSRSFSGTRFPVRRLVRLHLLILCPPTSIRETERFAVWAISSSINCCTPASSREPAISISRWVSRRCFAWMAGCGGSRPKCSRADDTVALMKSITPDRCQKELAEVGGTDFGFAFGELARFRVSVFKQRGNVAMVLRQIPNRLLTFEQLGTPPVVQKLCLRPRGLFLVTGPTGSGKSTTLASMINYINETLEHHIVTIEDPIEFYHTNKRATVNQREVGVDVPSFSEALRRVLRQDPDVILVGEMRDLETIEAAITAAETGHLVFGTLHTTGAQGTVNRIIDAFPTNQQEQVRTQLSTAIIGVLVAIAVAEDRRRPGGRVRNAGGHFRPSAT